MSFSAQSLGFQFTPLREGRPALNYTAEPFQQISIHAPPRGATDSGAEFRSAHHISIHAPPRGATTHPRHDCRHVVNFNSRPSARGDAGGSGWPPAGSAISIHAPPRGATVHRRSSRKPSGDFNSRPSARGDKCINHTVSVEHISIHAPPRGATHQRERFSPSTLFQFTPLREGRR